MFTGGLRESKMVDFETGTPHFPDDYPDSSITSQLEISEAVELTIKHHKYPPNKRPNYDKLNTNSPFRWVIRDSHEYKNFVFGACIVVYRVMQNIFTKYHNSAISSLLILNS